MSDSEKLPKSQPAEVRVGDTAFYAGKISALHGEGLLLTGYKSVDRPLADAVNEAGAGTDASLSLAELPGPEGDPLQVPVTIAEVSDQTIVLELHLPDAGLEELRERLRNPAAAQVQGEGGNAVETLPALRERALLQLDNLVGKFVDEAADHLFDMSGRPSSRDIQDDLYDSMNLLKRGRKEVVETFKSRVSSFFDNPTPVQEASRSESTDLDFTELGLVDIKEFEDSLLIDRMVKRWQDKFALPLEALTIRYAELTDNDAAAVRLPVHVKQLCEAYRESINTQELPNTVVPEVYSLFSLRVLAKLDSFYQSLNEFLSDRDVCPELDEDLESGGSLMKRREKAREDDRKKQANQKREEEKNIAEAEKEAAEKSTEDEQEATPDHQAPAPGAQAAPTPTGSHPGGSAPFPAAGAPGFRGAAPFPAYGGPQTAGPHPAGPHPAGPQTAGQPPSGPQGPGHSAPSTPQVGGFTAPMQGAGFPPQGQAGSAAPGSQPGTDAAAQQTPAQGVAGGRFNDATQLYQAVIEALNFRRGDQELPGLASGGGTSASGGGGGEAQASPHDLAHALTSLQSDEQARNQLQQQSVRDYLLQNQPNISALRGTAGFSPESINQLDLVDNLFTDISAEVDITADMRPVVNDLQVPLAKLALLEPRFFADAQHPARGVIDKATQLASSSNFPNKPLEQKLAGIIDNIVQNYDSDSEVFEVALKDLEALSAQQKNALERNVERVVKTQEGQEKLRKAEKAVEKILKNRIRPPRAPKPIVDLVDKGWRDLLKLTYVKRGPNSRAWKDYVKTLDLLSLWLLEQKRGEEDEELGVQRAMEAEPMIDMINQQISEALPTHVEHEEVLENLREVLAGRAELEFVDVGDAPEGDDSSADAVRARVENLPRLRRWVRRVEDLEVGSWLTYRDKQGARRRMQLAWIGEENDRFIFVNDRGQKVADMSNIELARRMSRGLKPPAPSEALPLVDQSMYKTLEHVQTALSFDKNHDSLTRLINRDKFDEQLEQSLQHAKAKHAAHALLYIDIDKFGLVNEVYDKPTGDQVLVEFGKLLAQQHGKKVSSARLGEDRFGVLMLDRTLEQAIAHAESIRSDIEQSAVNIDGENISFTVSIGVTAIRDHSESVEELVQHASGAAEEAKEQGGNRVSQFNEDKARVDAYKAEEEAVIKQIEDALDTKNFVLQAQPIARLVPGDDGSTVEHYEILMAISNDRGELHSPVEFISRAERFGFMTQVDQWVVREVFEWISALMDEQKVVPSIAINLSGNSVTDDSFMDYLFEQISEYGVGTNKICFEITETGTISNMVKATDFVNEFKNIGCKFSIDDFGTGLASHSYLRELPVDFVKIDGTFIKNIHNNPKDFAMTKSINDLAHFLGQETIAEFAENEEVISKLRDIGVDYVQGWGVGKPEPLSQLAGKLAPLEK